MESSRICLRHAVATLAYRATRSLENAPAAFAIFEGGGRQPIRILAHMGDLFSWALSMAQGNPRWNNSEPLEWTAELQRFYFALGAFDVFLASSAPLKAPIERLLQGAGGRCAHPRWAACHASPHGRLSNSRREFLCRRDLYWSDGP